MRWKRVLRRLPLKPAERPRWLGLASWLVVLGVSVWLLGRTPPEVVRSTMRNQPMSPFQIAALVSMVSAAFFGCTAVGLAVPFRGAGLRFCRAVAGALVALPLGVYVTDLLRQAGHQYSYGPGIAGAVFCGLAAAFLYPDPFADRGEAEPEADEAQRSDA